MSLGDNEVKSITWQYHIKKIWDWPCHGSPYQSVPMYRSIVGMVCIELYRAILSVSTHGTWEYTDVPPIPISCRTDIYHPYRVICYGTTNLGPWYMKLCKLNTHQRLQQVSNGIGRGYNKCWLNLYPGGFMCLDEGWWSILTLCCQPLKLPATSMIWPFAQ